MRYSGSLLRNMFNNANLDLMEASTVDLSIVIPVYNEQENIAPLVEKIMHSVPLTDYEIIFVDDGSTDRTVSVINECAVSYSSLAITVIEFARNYGQSLAIKAGIEAANGSYIATLDGDLQNDPADIIPMMKKLQQEQLDMVTGVRSKRQDGMLLRKIPSIIANKLIRKLTGVTMRDYGCTLKLYRQEIARKLELHGELHRFIPILSILQGAKIADMEVSHHPRLHGHSKYGLGRTLKVLSDLLLMLFFLKYKQKPMHLFGSLGIAMLLVGGGIESYLLILKFMGEDIGTRPLFYVGIMLILMAVQLIMTGFIAELVMRTYYQGSNNLPYHIRRIYQHGKSLDS